MKTVLALLFVPLSAFAQVASQAGGFSLNVNIQKKSTAGEIMVEATDDGAGAKLPIKLSVRVKCAGHAEWTDLRKQFPDIPKRVCYMFEERARDWQDGQQTLTIRWVLRGPNEPQSSAASSAPCSLKQTAEIDLREICR